MRLVRCRVLVGIVAMVLLSTDAVAEPLLIEALAASCTGAPAEMSVLELADKCAMNEAMISAGTYEAEQDFRVPEGSVGLVTESDFPSNKQMLFFKGSMVRTKRQHFNSSGEPVHDDEWAYEGGDTIRSLSELSQGAMIQENTGQLYSIPNWFRDLRAPSGFARDGAFSSWIRELHEKYPDALALFQCEHPNRGNVLVLDVNPSHKVFFDPQQGFAAFGQILYANREENQILDAYEVVSTTMQGGIPLPSVIHATQFGWGSNGEWVRRRYSTILFTAWETNPSLDDRLFTMEIPAGFHAYDAVNEKAITPALAPRDLNIRPLLAGAFVVILMAGTAWIVFRRLAK